MSADHDAVVHAAAAKAETAAGTGSSDGAWKAGGIVETRLDGLRVLVVEDEYLVALLLAEDLRAAGCIIAGPHVTLAAANAAALGESFDVAILDVNLNGEMVYPLAEQLADRGVPLVFLSGYDIGHFPERFRTTPRVAKPHDRAALLREIDRALSGSE